MKYLKIDNKNSMPIISFGTYQITDLNQCETLVLKSLDIGYRAVDNAQSYFNEEAVGHALSKTTIPRKEIFLTTKIWISNYGYEKTVKSVLISLEKLKTDYIDLVLIHQPFGQYYESYRALIELQTQGKIKYIGVSNFYPDRLVDIALFTNKKPQINPIEINPFFQQKQAIEWNKKYNVIVQAWAPFAEGKNDIFNNKTLKEIGQKYNKSVAQIILRWLVEKEIPFNVKSANEQRIKENFDIFNFQLSKEYMNKITQLELAKSSFFNNSEPQGLEIIHNLVK